MAHSTPARMLEYFDAPSLDLLRSRFPEIPAAARAAILFDQELESETRWTNGWRASRAQERW